MDYEKKLALAKEALDSGSYDKDTIEYIFPELAESEDERVRKELLNAFQEAEGSLYMVLTPHRRESFISWLKKQGEQKPTDKDMVEALRTEYEKGRADVIAKTLEWINVFNDNNYIMQYSDSCEHPINEIIEWYKNYINRE